MLNQGFKNGKSNKESYCFLTLFSIQTICGCRNSLHCTFYCKESLLLFNPLTSDSDDYHHNCIFLINSQSISIMESPGIKLQRGYTRTMGKFTS